jgi:MFS family permease
VSLRSRAASRTFHSLRAYRDFRLYMSGQIAAVIASWMQDTTLLWVAYDLTGSPVGVGLVAVCRYLPFAALSLLSGVVADRINSRTLVLSLQLASMLVVGVLAFLTLTGLVEPWHLYVLAAIGGTAVVFDFPAKGNLLFEIVGRDELSNAIALNASATNAARIVGPALGGILIAVAGAGACFALNAAAFVPSIVSLLLIHPRNVIEPGRPTAQTTAMRSIREGLAHARRDDTIRLVLLLVAAFALFGFNARVLLPVLSTETLRAGPQVFGALFACFGAGALVGSLVAASQARATWTSLLAGGASFSVVNLVLAPVRSTELAAALLLAYGACYTIWTANSQALLSMAAPSHLRGRILSLFLFAIAGVAPAGSLLTGWLTDLGGTQLAFSVAGAAGLAGSALATIRLRRSGALAQAPSGVQAPPAPDAII